MTSPASGGCVFFFVILSSAGRAAPEFGGAVSVVVVVQGEPRGARAGSASSGPWSVLTRAPAWRQRHSPLRTRGMAVDVLGSRALVGSSGGSGLSGAACVLGKGPCQCLSVFHRRRRVAAISSRRRRRPLATGGWTMSRVCGSASGLAWCTLVLGWAGVLFNLWKHVCLNSGPASGLGRL